MTELQIFRCAGCSAAWFPERLRCPRCGGAAFEPIPAGEGVVEQETALHRTPGAEGARLGSIRLAAGPIVIARLDDGINRGAGVRVHADTDNAIWARHR